jgi:thiamine kinase-like enzyme
MNETQKLIQDYLQQDITVETRLMGGMSNQMYVINVDDERCTFRIPGKNASMFVDRHIELKNIEAVRSLNINNETLVFDTNNGYKLAAYIDGTPFSQLDDLQLNEAASVLHELHDSSLRFDNDYDPFARLALYESYHKHLSEDYQQTKAQFLTYKTYLESQPKVACHNDAQRSNFVQANGKTYLLDWEFAGNNDPLYDIACFGNINFDHALALLPAYLGREASKDEIKRLTLWRTFQALQWHNVAWYKEDIGLSQELNVNFAAVAEKYLALAKSLLETVN